MGIQLELNKNASDKYIKSGSGHSTPIYHIYSEEILVSNVFGILKNIDIKWLIKLFEENGIKLENDDCSNAKFYFFQKVQPPKGMKKINGNPSEGPTEVDLIIETKKFLMFLEAKLLAGVGKNTTHSGKLGCERNQIIRNIDVGLNKSIEDKKDFVFIYLTDDSSEPPEFKKYHNKPESIRKDIEGCHSDTPEYRYEDASKMMIWLNWISLYQLLSKLQNEFSDCKKKFIDDLIKYFNRKFPSTRYGEIDEW